MSEIRSIAEGTFVIGDTNGLTFEAGTGITVSQPSEGTVRIANDETVLWEGDASPSLNVTSGSWSEPLSNFERVRMYWKNNDVGSRKCAEFPVESDWTYIGDVNPNAQWWKGITVFINNNGFTNIKCYELTLGFPSNGSEVNYFHLLKVVGINRISGGN